MSILEEAKELQSQLTTWRRALHQIPETDLTLPQTMDYVSGQLDELGVEYTRYDDISCITAVLGQGDKCLLMRGDFDALPLEEKSGESFASTNGCAHACGHDMHGATMLGVAKMLKAHESELGCKVKLLWQSGEETFRGAAAAIGAGVLENPKVDAAFAMHAFAKYDLGTIMYGEIPMGAVYGFKITLTGKGGHGSAPEGCIDPINAAVQVYLALQSLIAREVAPLQAASLTIGQLSGGSVANAIPDTAVLQGTLRTFDGDVRSMLIRRISEVAAGVAKTYRCGCDLEVLSDVPSLKNDPDFSEKCFASLEKAGVIKVLDRSLKLMGSEDFAYVSHKVPTCYLVSGAGVDDISRRRGQHNPEIVFNEEALALDTAAYVQVALDFANTVC